MTPDADATGARTIIGWKEFVVLPDWGVEPILAKADTGARTSAVDVRNIEELADERVRFELVVERAVPGGSPGRRVTIEAPVVRRSRVKSSFGAVHDRLVVRTTVRIGTVEKEVDLSLVSRRSMLCRMLLGRKALEPEFLVDPARRYRLGRPRRRRKGA